MSKLRICLLSILFGQLTIIPYTVYLYKTPKIEALVVPDSYQFHNEIFHLQIKNVHNVYHLGGSVLNIYLAPENKVNEEYQKEFKDDTPILGFYNVQTNTIWSVFDPLILWHELKHVFEGAYHR